MNEREFSKESPGKLVAIDFIEHPSGPLGDARIAKTMAFVPAPLPPVVDWKQLQVEHFERYTRTVAELGRLNGLHKRVGNAASLLRTLWMREAKLSSQVEDIDTTAEELVLAGAGRSLGVRESGRESWNYVKALEHGVHSELPFSTRVIKEMHEALLSGVRGDENRPGQFRNCNVYLGNQSQGVRNARFVPPPCGDALVDAMSELEKFVNDKDNKIPPLFLIALTHYQFETIHPFRDGNGRIGRVLISRSLVKEGLLDHPVVYMSAYINEHKQEYVDLLRNISRSGGEAWSDWIAFILDAICTQARDAIGRSEQLIALREDFHNRLKETSGPSRLFKVVDHLFSMPAINIAEIIESTGVSKPTATADVDRLEDLNILTEYTGRQRDRDWVARDVIKIIEEDTPLE
ncbi:Adenosine monophosphate-protein transferase SoFic [Rosistilla carotiformis]|uniref:Adenosine monophosphate-protein transferase SoFic n=1 Tax=Rosistilla carotiformis TaxID=2528017 RepID=A0A518JN88_9BACT|nr:Fic family protein [Rosistilla carotiformis]QDV66971.1 Adenosine monophosphate-protein transferase SoFic [Rosistilla carotiformis]